MDDYALKGASLDFGDSLEISGETAFINLKNHRVKSLSIYLTFSFCYLNNF